MCRPHTLEHGWIGGLVGFLLLSCCNFFTPVAGTSDGPCSPHPPITDWELWPELLKQLTLSPDDSELSTVTNTQQRVQLAKQLLSKNNEAWTLKFVLVWISVFALKTASRC